MRTGVRGDALTYAFHAALVLYLLFGATVLVISMHSGRSSSLIVADGIGYYAWLRSAMLDRDADFRNDYGLLIPPDPFPPEMAQRTPRGHVPNKYPVGLALIEIPGFALGHVAARLGAGPANGASAPYQLGVTLWLQAIFVGGVLLLYRALRELDVPVALAVPFALSGALATNALHYFAKEVSWAHGTGMALASAAMFVGARARARGLTARRAVALGVLFGALLLVRTTNVTLAPFFIAFLWPAMKEQRRTAMVLVAVIVAVGAVQPAVASWFWQRPTVVGYGQVGEGFTSGFAGVVGTLFSNRHGLFIYHPWYALTLLGCVAAMLQPAIRALGLGAILSFLTLAAFNGTWWCWWFATSFGNRAFIEIVPVLLVPTALWASLKARSRASAIPVTWGAFVTLSLANFVLWVGFVLWKYPGDGQHGIAQAWLWFVNR